MPLLAEVIKQVLRFLGGLASTSYTSVVLIVPSTVLKHAIVVAPKMDAGFEIRIYSLISTWIGDD